MKTTLLPALRRAALLLVAFAFATAARAQTIANPSFEANSYTVFPGYIFTPGNGGIAGWSYNGAVGLNPAGGNPFADNGAVPQGSNVAFIQSVNLPGDYGNGVSLLNTVITGLTPGVSYTVSFRANSRTSSFYGAPTPSWSVNGEAFLPFTAAPSVGGTNAYYTVTRTFTATAATAPLNIMNDTAATGGPADTTVLIDDFQIAVVPPVVTNTLDSGPGSLRQVLAYAATIPGADTVTFDPSLSGATIVLGSEIVVDDAASVTIDASSLPAGVTLSGNNATRLFTVSSGKNLALLGLTLTGGNGGAILNDGTTTLDRCTLASNSAGSGGAIFNQSGTMTLTHCTLSDNHTVIFGGGGAIVNAAAMTLTNCTLAGNGSGFGGAIYNQGTLTLTHCTLAGNSANDAGGGIFNKTNSLTLTNSIVAGNTGSSSADIYNEADVTRAGANIVQSYLNAGGTESGPPAIDAPPLLAPLDNYGGPTRTMVPQPGSPAIDAATVLGGLTTDQRGFARNGDGDGTGGTAPDIGAVELNRVVVTTNADELDTPSSSGVGLSLREAIRDGADLAVFAPALNSSVITFITLFGGEIVLAKSVTIDATSLPAGLTLDGGPGANRLFTVSSGRSLALLGLTLTGGNGSGGTGGALLNNGATTLDRCTLAGNSAGSGGAIFNQSGTMTLTHCTLSDNHTVIFGGGGAIVNAAAMTLTNCTFAGNGSGFGGAIYNQGTLTLTHCTLAGNSANDAGGGIFNKTNSLTLTNSIVAGNTGSSSADIYNEADVTRAGANIVQSYLNAGGTESGPPAIDAPPLLAPLDNYGGPTKTRALQPGSPARNAATGSLATSDQRGFPIVGTPDIGAYEAGTFTNYNAYIWESLPVAATTPQHASGVDFDGDGVTNGNEWLALTDAADPANYLRITQVVLSGSDILLTFPTVVGRTYSFEFNLNLATGTWTPLGFTRIGDGEIQTMPIGPVTGQPQLFFRIRVGP